MLASISSKFLLGGRTEISRGSSLNARFNGRSNPNRSYTLNLETGSVKPTSSSYSIPATSPLGSVNVDKLIAQRLPRRSLQQEFYTSKDVFQADMSRIWNKSWLFAGFTIEIPKPGDFFTYQVGNENLIIVRGDDNKINALYNLCRHRGSKVCLEAKGNSNRFVCPYHAWSYGRDGKLLKANYMDQPNFKKEENGMYKASAEEVGGMIFINLQENASGFEEARQVLEPEIKPHGLEQSKIAYTADYDIEANWKLVYENNRECYHCNIGHPEYIKANYDTSFTYTDTGRVVDPAHPARAEIEQYIEEKNASWKALGLQCSPDSSFPGAGWYRASRTPNRKGWVTESLDGQPVSTLMGQFTDRDMGSCRIHTLPNFWIHASSDHAVATRLTPINETQTKAKVMWLVDRNAEEGKDYHLEKMLPFWKATSEQDWELCENNQLGVNSHKYQPGPLSDKKEAGVEKFINWYLKNMKAGAPQLD
eukprot:TRINITY_DN10911_c0_g1_i1.p1 TRINITY_DN10911_c0_g1~~TRINITY_DN10911_c0_g1_i1.p1  ORF type:complete len:478 (-),score=156.57 TRINITY_DN10911_c0_g1_i1:97-1530(-)